MKIAGLTITATSVFGLLGVAAATSTGDPFFEERDPIATSLAPESPPQEGPYPTPKWPEITHTVYTEIHSEPSFTHLPSTAMHSPVSDVHASDSNTHHVNTDEHSPASTIHLVCTCTHASDSEVTHPDPEPPK